MMFYMSVITDDGREARVAIPPYPEQIAGFGPAEFLDDVHSLRMLYCYRALEHIAQPEGPMLPKDLENAIAD